MDLPRTAISLRQLGYLVAVADAGSFTAAAERTHVAQPALSRQIATLEAAVGQRLLVRSHTGIALTEGGAQLYDVARNMLERLSGVRAALRSGGEPLAGAVKVAMPSSIAALLVPGVVREIEATHPGIALRVDDGSSRRNGRGVTDGSLDFAIVPAADELVGGVYEPLVRESLHLVVRRDGRGARAGTIRLEEVGSMKLAMPPREFHARRAVDDAALVANCALDVAYEHASVPMLVSLVRSGLAATIASPVAVRQFWRRGEVYARRIVHPGITRTLSIARGERALTPASAAVYDVVKRHAARAVADGRWPGVPLR